MNARNLSIACALAGLALAAPLPADGDPPRQEASGADDIWQAVLDVTRPDQASRARAEEHLKQAGPAGVRALLRAASLGCLRNVILSALTELGYEPTKHETFGVRPTRPPGAAAMAVRLLKRDAELQDAYLASPNPLERYLALASLIDDPARLDAAIYPAAAGMDRQTSLQLDKLSSFVRQRGLEPGIEDAILVKLKAVQREIQQADVDEQLDIGDLVAGFVRGHCQVDVCDSRSIRIYRGRNRSSVSISHPEAIEIYRRASERGVRPALLLWPLFKFKSKHMKPAAELLIRDLPKLDEKMRKRMATLMVNAGFEVPVEIEIDRKAPGWSGVEKERREAAIRQGSQQAREAIEAIVFCRSGADGWIPLLGYSGEARSAELAAELAERCPLARAYAAAALVRLQDPRALGLLEPALKRPGAARFHLERAVLERGTPELRAELARLAAGRLAGAVRLQAILSKRRPASKDRAPLKGGGARR
ncbi:MAG: hypothetical protein JXR96_20855 [Deltaproteobacteria bacterium]|nr:hypothetical protein [Deltaproteobacteria bacterium]